MSRQDHRNYDAALQKLRAEMATKPKEHRGRELILLGIGALTDFIAVRFASSVFVWIAAIFFVAGFWSYTKSLLPRFRYPLNIAGLIVMLAGTFYLDTYKVQPDKIEKKLDQILLGQRWDSETLSASYPIGYVIFNLNSNNRIVFHKRRSCFGDFKCDWNKVAYLENKPEHFEIQLPSIRNERLHIEMGKNDTFGGPKQAGWIQPIEEVGAGGIMYTTICEVLDTDDTGITLLIGLKSRPF
jgi:hypothetical protein